MKIIFTAILAMSISNAAFPKEVVAPSSAHGAPGNRDHLIEQVMMFSGMKRMLENMPLQVATGVMQTALNSGASTDEERELVKSLEKSLPRDAFVTYVHAVMRKNYDEQRYAHFLRLLSTPLAKRMLELEFEAQEPKPGDVQAFLAQLAKRPLPPERIKLIQRIDVATQSSALLTSMAISSLEAGALVAGDGCSATTIRIKKAIEESRPKIERANRSNVQVTLAFTYREVSDMDLDAYSKIYEDPANRWVMGIAQAGINEQYKSSVENATQGIKSILSKHKPKKTMFAPKCGQSESPEMDKPHNEQVIKEEQVSKLPAQKKVAPVSKVAVLDNRNTASAKVVVPAGKFHRSRAGRDLRSCLSLATSAEIIACAEK